MVPVEGQDGLLAYSLVRPCCSSLVCVRVIVSKTLAFHFAPLCPVVGVAWLAGVVVVVIVIVRRCCRLLGHQLSLVLRKALPQVHAHLLEAGMSFDMLAAQWLLPLLSTSLTMPCLARVWDLFLTEVGCRAGCWYSCFLSCLLAPVDVQVAL